MTPTNHDARLIGASHASRGGRIRNIQCRPNRSGDSSIAGAESTKRCVGVQSGQPKERCDRTREKDRTQSTEQKTFHVPTARHPDGISPTSCRRAGANAAPAPAAFLCCSVEDKQFPWRTVTQAATLQEATIDYDFEFNVALKANAQLTRRTRAKPGKSLLDRSASFRDGPTSADS